MNSKRIFFQSTKYKFSGLIIFLLLSSTQLYSQTEISVAPGESVQIVREHSISILPITGVTIHILGEDSLYVAGTVDSFTVITGILKVRTHYTLFVTLTAPIGELSIQVLLVYKADNVLSQDVREDFLIDASVPPSIVANFTANPIEGLAPLNVNFNNESTGNIVGYFWDFGDSTTSTEQNPQHIYQNPGTYTVSLTVFNFNVQNKKIKQDYINVQEAVSIKNDVSIQPNEIYLSQNYPNPFNSSTTINYTLRNTGNVNLFVFDINGKVVKRLVSNIQNSGDYSVSFDASNLSSGIYIYKLKTNSYEQSRKMIILR